VVFSAAGKFLRTVGPTRVHGLEVRAERGGIPLLRAPVRSRGRQTQLDGEAVWTIHYPQEAGIYKTRRDQSLPVTIAPDGSIFVADGYGSNYVLKFDKDRKFVKAFGGPARRKESSRRATASRWTRARANRCCCL